MVVATAAVVIAPRLLLLVMLYTIGHTVSVYHHHHHLHHPIDERVGGDGGIPLPLLGSSNGSSLFHLGVGPMSGLHGGDRRQNKKN